jgi:hypothetical protein
VRHDALGTVDPGAFFGGEYRRRELRNVERE